MEFNFIKKATILFYFWSFTFVNSVPLKIKDDIVENRGRINRHISVEFPFVSFELKSSLPVPDVLDIFDNSQQNENHEPIQQESTIEAETSNYTQITDANVVEDNEVTDNFTETNDADLYTTVDTTTEYDLNTETVSTETEPTLSDDDILRSEVSPQILSSLLGK